MHNAPFLFSAAPISLDNFNPGFTGLLTAVREDAVAAHAKLGGYLLRMGNIFLVCSGEEALGWGWTPEELKQLPLGEERRILRPRNNCFFAPC
jgi:hypothetical protein